MQLHSHAQAAPGMARSAENEAGKRMQSHAPYLETLPQTSGMYMGNASIIPRNYRKYLYHAYLAYMEANGYRNVLSLKMFGLGLPVMLKEYGLNYEKRHTKQGIQTNLTLKEESYGDWLPKCDDPATT